MLVLFELVFWPVNDLRVGSLLHPNFHAQETVLARTTHLVLRIANICRSSPGKSLQRVFTDLVEGDVPISGDDAAQLRTKQILFVLVGYLTLLYTLLCTHALDLDLGQLRIEISETSTTTTT